MELGTLTIVEMNTKSRRAHQLPLSDYLWSLLKDRSLRASSPFVFPGKRTKSGYLTDGRHVMEEVIRETKITFNHHDLRRTFASIAEFMSIPNFTIKRLLNHELDNDVTGGYLVAGFDDDSLREPMQRITDFILGEAGIKEAVHGSIRFVPIKTDDYHHLKAAADHIGVSLEDLIHKLAGTIPRVPRVVDVQPVGIESSTGSEVVGPRLLLDSGR